jgi:hypothetical protein
MAVQLRRYQFAEGALAPWLPHWRQNVVPLREAYDFRVLSAFADLVNDQFVWAVEYDGTGEELKARDREYHDSPQWAALNEGKNVGILRGTVEIAEAVWP